MCPELKRHRISRTRTWERRMPREIEIGAAEQEFLILRLGNGERRVKEQLRLEQESQRLSKLAPNATSSPAAEKFTHPPAPLWYSWNYNLLR